MADLSSLSQRFWKALTDGGVYKAIGRLHTPLYRLTGGRIGHRAAGVTNLLLTTTGRKSGEPRTVTLAYIGDGERWILIGSHGGNDKHPAWFLNLRDKPEAEIQVGAEVIRVRARIAAGEERAALWKKACDMWGNYARYQTITDREIPVVVLERT
jgi:deazaflavin-dependent oxidoreductase (nitroreductase family)